MPPTLLPPLVTVAAATLCRCRRCRCSPSLSLSLLAATVAVVAFAARCCRFRRSQWSAPTDIWKLFRVSMQLIVSLTQECLIRKPTPQNQNPKAKL
ncbi:hypothetical protein GW17_00005279 [Ensete ventricosum]|nr:hypothetical protein GW17_00005279 [Ensete ventricosum]